MNNSHKFDPKKMAKLDSPERRKKLPVDKVLQLMPIENGSIIADIGCGIGYFTLPLAQLVGDNGIIYAIDIEEVMLQETKRRADITGLKNINYIISEENRIPLTDYSVDVALLACLYHELQDTDKFLKEVKRLLKSNGTILIVDWRKEETAGGPPLEHRVSIEEATEELDKNGFDIVKATNISEAFYSVVANLNMGVDLS